MAAQPAQDLGVFVGGVVVQVAITLPAGTARSMAFKKRMNS